MVRSACIQAAPAAVTDADVELGLDCLLAACRAKLDSPLPLTLTVCSTQRITCRPSGQV